MRATPVSHAHESLAYKSHAHEMHAYEMHTQGMHAHDMYALKNHALESHTHKRYSYKNPFCYSIPPYRWKDPTERKPAHPLSYRLWWMMLPRRTFSQFSEFRFCVFLSL